MTYLNVVDFGAKGDGKTDDTAAVLAAMEKATKENGTVYFPRGNYAIHPIKVPSHITLMGNSAWGYSPRKDGDVVADPGYMGNTVLTALSSDANAFLDLDGNCGTRIIGLSLDGRNLGECMHGIYSRHRGVEQNNCYEDCRISNFTGCGLKMDWVWVFAIRRCLIMYNKLHGIDVDRGYDGWVIDNQVSANGKMGINAGPGMVCYTGNRIECNGEGGIFCDDTQNVNITGNSFDHNRGPAIWFRNSRASAASGNMSRNDGAPEGETSCAYLIEGSQGIALSGNTAWDWNKAGGKYASKYGIVVKDLTDCAITGNAMHAAATEEVMHDLGGHKRCVFSGNVGSLTRQ